MFVFKIFEKNQNWLPWIFLKVFGGDLRDEGVSGVKNIQHEKCLFFLWESESGRKFPLFPIGNILMRFFLHGPCGPPMGPILDFFL
jgi:hypothetical protein